MQIIKVVNITDRYRAKWDTKCWELQEYTDIYGTGKEKHTVVRQDWKFVGYYVTMEQVLNGILKYESTWESGSGLGEYVEHIKRARNELLQSKTVWNPIDEVALRGE